MSHKCPVKECETKVPANMLMCHRHWYMVPRDIQSDVWKTYRIGPGSGLHRKAMMAAVTAVEENLTRKKAVKAEQTKQMDLL
jgi:hypothetical protein